MASSIVLSFVGQQDPYSENTNKEGSIATLIRHLLDQKYNIRRVILLHTQDVAQKASDTKHWLQDKPFNLPEESIELVPVGEELSTDPVSLLLAVQEARKGLEKAIPYLSKQDRLEFNASSGTPVMKTSWSLLQAAGYASHSSVWQVRNPEEIKEGQPHVFQTGQKGSSAMPHKRNPIRSERLTGMARILRGNAVAALENVALWHERDISHSSVERICMPDSCIITHFMLVETTQLIKNLLIYPENMARNLNCYGGVVFSQGVLLALVGKGMNREEAYSIVQENAMAVWNTTGGDFRALTSGDPRVTQHLSPTEIDHCFDPNQHLKHLDEVYQRLSI